MGMRNIVKTYEDPLDLVWTHCAASIGIQIERDDEVFASWNGRGTLRVGKESLDPDDSLAQMILHELCHALVEGPDAFSEADWGLNTPTTKSRVHEFAALRLQAGLADGHGLRTFFSATTDFHEYYGALPDDPFRGFVRDESVFECLRPVTRTEDRQAIDLANNAHVAWLQSLWREPMENSLRATAEIRSAIQHCVPADSLWKSS